MARTEVAPALIVFGAFDRHNFGDMLFAHVAERLIAHRRPDMAPVFAGLAGRDLRAYGGHDVKALAWLSAHARSRRAALLHAGGEVLTCDAWQAAVMLTSPDETQACIARHGASESARRAWACSMLGTNARVPYVSGRVTAGQDAPLLFNAIGGAHFASLDAAARAEVLTKLRSADDLSVRDRQTQRALHAAGIEARLVPDPASLTRELFDARIRVHAHNGDVAGMRRKFAQGYLAVQFSADFGDDATLARLAHRLDALGTASKLGIVLFRAGAAPWHDDIGAYERLAARMQYPDVAVFRSLNVWDICALIAHGAGFAGSSLHGRIVAMAYGLPRVNLLHLDDAAGTGKQGAYAATWDVPRMPGAVPVDELDAAMLQASNVTRDDLRDRAMKLAHAYRAGMAPLADWLANIRAPLR